MQPLSDHLFVRKKVVVDRQTEGGLYIPQTAKEGNYVEGVVIAVGPGAKDKDGNFQSLNIQVGARVLFTKYAGVEVEINGEKVVILQEKDLLAFEYGDGDYESRPQSDREDVPVSNRS